MAKWDGVGRARSTAELVGTAVYVLGAVFAVACLAYGLIWVFS